MINRRVEVYQKNITADGEETTGFCYEGMLLEFIKDSEGEICGIVIDPDGFLNCVSISLLTIID